VLTPLGPKPETGGLVPCCRIADCAAELRKHIGVIAARVPESTPILLRSGPQRVHSEALAAPVERE